MWRHGHIAPYLQLSSATQSVVPDVQLVISSEIGSTLTGALGNLPGDLQSYSGVFNSMNIPDLRIPNIGSIITGSISSVVEKLNKNLNIPAEVLIQDFKKKTA